MGNTEQTIMKAESSQDFLSFVPALLGFTPRRSLVLVPFVGSRTYGAMRFDLPEVVTSEVAATAIGYICRVEGVTGVAVVVYTDADAPTARPIGEPIITRAALSGLDVVDALYVSADGWGSFLLEGEPQPVEGIAVPELLAPTVAPGVDQITTAEPMSTSRAALIATALAEIDLEAVDWCAAFERACTETDPTKISPEDAAFLLLAVERPLLRDVGLVQWASDAEGGAAALRVQKAPASERDPSQLPRVAQVITGEGPRPERTRLVNALGAVLHLSGSMLDPHPGALAVAAWLSWALGRSTQAHQFANHAVSLDAEHGLGNIVAAITDHGFLPAWVFRR